MKDTYTVADVKRELDNCIDNLRRNKIDPANVPFVIQESWHKYKPYSIFTGFGRNGATAGIEFFNSDEIKFVAPDKRPDIPRAEFWKSRGCGGSSSDPDCSGFVVSKLAGERLLRFVKYILEKDETETWLDYREQEPNWIQFKFSGKEFDIEKLDEYSKTHNGIITEDIIRECKI